MQGAKIARLAFFLLLLHHNRRKLFVFHTQKTYATIIPQLYLERGLLTSKAHESRLEKLLRDIHREGIALTSNAV